MSATITCQHCSVVFESQRRTRKFCSPSCANRAEWKVAKARTCRHCGAEFMVTGAGDCNRQHCSKECAKNHNAKQIKAWRAENKHTTPTYRANQLAKDPEYERRATAERRQRILDLLGGKCVVCFADKPSWLHVDYIPTGRGEPYRHPRHYRFVSENRHLFRILCANHHYELTLTGAIEGTDIRQ